MLFKNYFLLSVVVCMNFYSFSQSESNRFNFNGNTFDTFIVKIDNSIGSHFIIAENEKLIKHNDLLNSIPKDEWFLTTAGIVDSTCMPLGYYVNNDKLIQDINLKQGKGNFYLKPNGIFLIQNNNADICETNKISNFKNIKYAIQSGPMLVINSKIHSVFNINSSNKYIRSGVGVYKNNKNVKFIVFAISKEAINFYSFADFFLTKLNCNNALCLESQRSVMSIPFLPNNTDNKDAVVCRYIIFKN